MDGLIQGVDKWFLRIWIRRADDFDFPRIGLSFYKDNGLRFIDQLSNTKLSFYVCKKNSKFSKFFTVDFTDILSK